MSRYGLLLEDENLDVCLGFEEGLGSYFLTVADARVCTGDAGTYLFHNYDHHPGSGMALEEVVTTCQRFGITLPQDLIERLTSDALQCGVAAPTPAGRTNALATASPFATGPSDHSPPHRVLGWQSVIPFS